MQSRHIFPVLVGFIALTACGPQETANDRRREEQTAARKVGEAAHKASVKVDKAGREIGRELRTAAHDAKEGWKDDASKDQKDK
jgi:hypothetical protein